MTQYPQTLTVALVGLLFFYCMGLITAFACGTISSLGSLTRPKPRRGVNVILHLFLLLFISELPWLVYSTQAATSSSVIPANNCTSYSNVVYMFYVEIGIAWVIYLIILAWYMIVVDPCKCFSIPILLKRLQPLKAQHLSSEATRPASNQGLHDVFCRVCCQCDGIKKKKKSARTAIADLLKTIGITFGDFNATFTDLGAGFMLVKQYQRDLSTQGKNPETELILVIIVAG